jgi:hypothetical protein
MTSHQKRKLWGKFIQGGKAKGSARPPFLFQFPLQSSHLLQRSMFSTFLVSNDLLLNIFTDSLNSFHLFRPCVPSLLLWRKNRTSRSLIRLICWYVPLIINTQDIAEPLQVQENSTMPNPHHPSPFRDVESINNSHTTARPSLQS